jgi:PucR-like helix-turn-helix protein/diguanylate cyclase with GGDEF domain
VSKYGVHPLNDDSHLAGTAGRSHRVSANSIRKVLATRLRERLHELMEATATRVYAISDPHEVVDPGYLHGLDAAVAAAVDYRLAALEVGERHTPAIPLVLLGQARLDARNDVPLDTVLRRYLAGNSLFGDFLVEEAEQTEVSSRTLGRLLAAQATLGDRLLEAVSEEYRREAKTRPTTPEEHARAYVKGLLAGRQPTGEVDLGYDLDAHHLGLMAVGDGADEVMREVAKRLDRRLLAGRREEEPVWAWWLGGRRPLEMDEALQALSDVLTGPIVVTVGEPAGGLSGWRLSHRQAKAALPIAERSKQPILRYADVALLASILRDDLVATSLHKLYLEPLERARDGGKVARETLRAYFAAERNISSTAAALGVDRRTVSNRIRAIEELLGRSLKGSVAELEIALRWSINS